MPATGKKRVRKDEEEGEGTSNQKKPKARHDREKSSPKRAAATPVLAASPVAAAPMRASSTQKQAPRVASKQQQEAEDTLGNPYEASRATTTRIAKKKQDEPRNQNPTETVVESVSTNGVSTGSAPKDLPVVKKSRNPTSIPCILLFLVAVLMWCTVTLLGLLLSERMDHELQIFTLRDMLHNTESVTVPPPPKVEELEKNVHFWKGRAQQLESQKKGMLQEFGEKIASLEYME